MKLEAQKSKVPSSNHHSKSILHYEKKKLLELEARLDYAGTSTTHRGGGELSTSMRERRAESSGAACVRRARGLI